MLTHRLFLDSGAPTLYHKWARKVEDGGGYMGTHLKHRHLDDFSWLQNEEYLAYRQRYIDYIRENEHMVEVYTNLDIINNAEATYENQKYFESQGLKPLPVWHFGEDISWLVRYIDEGYTYIGIGGLVPNPFTTLQPALDEIYSKYICNSDGMPMVKLHGFAATSVRLITRYPWWSVDSASWIKYAAFGGVMIPQKVKGDYRYTIAPHKIALSGKSPAKKAKGQHITNLSPSLTKYVMEYIHENGFVLGESTFEEVDGKLIEHVVVPGLINRPEQRCFLNALYYTGLTKQIPEWPWAFQIKPLALL